MIAQQAHGYIVGVRVGDNVLLPLSVENEFG